MNIIWITLETILPANSGGRLGVFKRLEKLSKNNNIFLFYPYDSEEDVEYTKELKKYCVDVKLYFRPENKRKAYKGMFRYPYTVSSRNISAMRKDIEECIAKNTIDVINVDFPHMCVNLIGLKTDIPIVLNEHNIEWKVYRSIAKSQRNIIKKFIYFIDSYRLKSYEKKILKTVCPKIITFVSDKDMAFMQKSWLSISENLALKLVPVGADIVHKEGQKKEKNTCNQSRNIIFVGKMSYGPNIEAVQWFVKNIFPQILSRYPSAVFYIVGKEPTDSVLALQNTNIVVTGMVDSVSEFYNKADLVVLPLLNGGGVKVKLLEAVSYRVPIVSTSVGAEGTVYSNGKSIFVSDDCNTFSKMCINVLNHEMGAMLREQKAYKIFLENYTWDKIGNKYEKLLREVARGIDYREENDE